MRNAERARVWRSGRVCWAALALGSAVQIGNAIGSPILEPPPPKLASAAPTRYEKFAVAADHRLASEAGAEILRAGGNAVDGAVATSLALSVVRPFSCGIGGGGFMVVTIPNGITTVGDGPSGAKVRHVDLHVAINYRETAPAAVGPDYFENVEDDNASTRGGKACGVPGTVAGLMHALEKYGSMDRARVCAPAIRLARQGFVVDAAYASAADKLAEKFENQPEWKTRFAFVWERFLQRGTVAVGDVIKLPEQAAVLEKIAEHGVDGFYKGDVAEAIVSAARAAGGEVTLADLAGFKVLECQPLHVEVEWNGDKRTLLMMPPPSSGGLAMAEVFGILSRKKLDDVSKSGNGAEYTHYVVESFKHAFADRARFLGDPAFVDVPAARLLSKQYLDELASRMRLARTMGREMYGTLEPLEDDGGTSHLCVVDSRGMAVACTETINLSFGSLVSSSALGFCLNDEMDDFTTRRGKANAFGLKQSDLNLPAPGKRPLSSMSPTIVLDADGQVVMVAGASGGPRIITATTQAILNALVRGDSAEKAVSRRRVHHQWSPNVLEIEDGYAAEWARHEGLAVDLWMRKLGHQTQEATEGAAVQVIAKRDGKWEPGCDPRKGGAPAGE